MQRLPVFCKQRDNLFYPGWAYTFPTTFLELPYCIIETVVWTAIVYYVVGLAPEAQHFFIFILILVVTQFMAVGMFRLMVLSGERLLLLIRRGPSASSFCSSVGGSSWRSVSHRSPFSRSLPFFAVMAPRIPRITLLNLWRTCQGCC